MNTSERIKTINTIEKTHQYKEFSKGIGIKDGSNFTDDVKAKLLSCAPDSSNGYETRELIDTLDNFQNAFIEDITKRLDTKIEPVEFVTKLNQYAEEKGIKETAEFKSCVSEIEKLGNSIRGLKRGVYGERKVSEALRRLECDKGVRVLKNICMEYENLKTEYDAIAITPYGIFVVEVKNTSSDVHIDEKGIMYVNGKRNNLAEKMNNKEIILRSIINGIEEVPYHAIVVFVDNRITVTDEYRRIQTGYCNSVTDDIRCYKSEGINLTDEQISRIEKQILSSSIGHKVLCDLEAEKIVEAYLGFISYLDSLETCEKMQEENEQKPEETFEKSQDKHEDSHKTGSKKELVIRYLPAAITTAATIATAALRPSGTIDTSTMIRAISNATR